MTGDGDDVAATRPVAEADAAADGAASNAITRAVVSSVPARADLVCLPARDRPVLSWFESITVNIDAPLSAVGRVRRNAGLVR